MVKNEEKRIKGCIDNISSIADEVIVIDNGSEDHTVEIARNMGAVVSICTDKKFDMARNQYLDIASHDWIFVLDADEYIDSTAKENVIELIREKSNCSSFMVPRYEYIGEGKWALIEICRLFRNDHRIRYTNTMMHASVGPAIRRINGINGRANFAIHHFDGLLGNKRMEEKRKRNINLTLDDIEKKRCQGNDLYYLYCYLGLEYAALGDYEKAEYIYRKAMRIGSDYKQFANIYLAQNHFIQGKYTDAYREAYNLVGVKNDIKQRALLLLAEIEYCNGNYKKTFELCEEIEKFDDNNAANKLNMATLLLDKDRDKAMQYLLKAKQINPFVMESIIYQKGGDMNVFAQQTSFLSCTYNAKELMGILL